MISIIGTVGVPACYGGFETLVDNLLDENECDQLITVYCSSKSYNNRPKKYKNAVLKSVPSIGMTYQFFYSNEVGKNEMNKSNVLVFPNPCTNRLNIENNGGEIRSYEVISIDGKIWKKEAMNSTGLISTDQLPPGAYFLKLTNTNDEVLLHKFLKR